MKRNMNDGRAMVFAVSGLAVGLAGATATGQAFELTGGSMDGAATLRPNAVQPILGVRMDGSLVLGERVVMSGADASARARGLVPEVVYDSLITADTDGDGVDDFVCGDLCGGLSFPSSRFLLGDITLAYVDDVEFSAAAAEGSSTFDGFRTLVNLTCDPAPLEPLILIASVYDSPITGFDTDGDGQVDSPYSRTDADGDGLVDEFSAGVVITFANIDTDGDPSNGNEALLFTPGFNFLFADLLSDTDGDGISGDPGAIDFGSFPTGDRDGDGNPDGAFELFFAGREGPDTDGDGFPDSGSIFNAFEASSLGPGLVLWGTPDTDTSGCAASFGITAGSSGGSLWLQNQEADVCTPDSAMAGNVWDPTTDFTDLTAVAACPSALTPSVQFFGLSTGDPTPCADSNGNGVVDPGDFNAWVIEFNTQGPGCDQNGDGQCTPADFNAWVLNFNSGSACP